MIKKSMTLAQQLCLWFYVLLIFLGAWTFGNLFGSLLRLLLRT